MAPKVIVRMANFSDYLDILEMGDMFEGMDYMQHKFHTYIADPRVYGIVAEVDQKVVGFLYFVILDGKTVMSGEARTHPHYRHRGILKMMGGFMHQFLREKFESKEILQEFRLHLSNDPLPVALEKEEGVFLTRWRYLVRISTISDLAHMLKRGQAIPTLITNMSQTGESVRPLSLEEVLGLLSPEIKEKFFPHDCIVAFEIMYPLTKTNLEKMLEDNFLLFGHTENKELMGVSVVTWYPCKLGTAVQFHYFGNSEHSLIQTLSVVLQSYCSQWYTAGEVTLELYFPEELNSTIIANWLDTLPELRQVPKPLGRFLVAATINKFHKEVVKGKI